MIPVAIILKNYKYAELLLEKIIEIYTKREDWKTVYRQYNNLVLHLLKTDLKKVKNIPIFLLGLCFLINLIFLGIPVIKSTYS